jgi:hypothetical protein
MKDPVVEEIRERRRRLLRERYRGSVRAFVADAVRWSTEHSDKVTSLRTRRRRAA